MRRAPNARRTVLALLSAAMLGLALVLGLWQQVQSACGDGASEATDAFAACEPIPTADVRAEL